MGAGMAHRPNVAEASLAMRTLAVLIVSRLGICNAVAASFVIWLNWNGFLNRHMALIFCIVCSSPTATNIVLVANVQGVFIKPTAVLLFLMQIAAIFTMTISIAVSLSCVA